jgi:signal transduction histidine kinase
MRRHDQRERHGDKLRHHGSDWNLTPMNHEPRFAAGTQEIEKLQACDPEISGLVDIVHDLKNPLSTIGLEMCLLAEKLGTAAPPDMQSCVQRIRLNIAYLDRMVQDLLDAAAIDDAHLALHRGPTDLRDLVVQTIERSVASRDLERITMLAPTGVVLRIDALRIERVLANLINNALKYAPAPTPVTITIDVGTTRVLVSVADRGPGLTPEEQERAFEKYGRGSNAGSHEGSGLGLYVARQIIEAHGGSIDVFSVPNVGSRFFFELPVS